MLESSRTEKNTGKERSRGNFIVRYTHFRHNNNQVNQGTWVNGKEEGEFIITLPDKGSVRVEMKAGTLVRELPATVPAQPEPTAIPTPVKVPESVVISEPVPAPAQAPVAGVALEPSPAPATVPLTVPVTVPVTAPVTTTVPAPAPTGVKS